MGFSFLPDGKDYLGATETITFEPGQSIATVQVMITNDNVYEGVQEFSARLTTIDSGVNIFEPEGTIQITDDDGNLRSCMYQSD